LSGAMLLDHVHATRAGALLLRSRLGSLIKLPFLLILG